MLGTRWLISFVIYLLFFKSRSNLLISSHSVVIRMKHFQPKKSVSYVQLFVFYRTIKKTRNFEARGSHSVVFFIASPAAMRREKPPRRRPQPAEAPPSTRFGRCVISAHMCLSIVADIPKMFQNRPGFFYIHRGVNFGREKVCMEKVCIRNLKKLLSVFMDSYKISAHEFGPNEPYSTNLFNEPYLTNLKVVRPPVCCAFYVPKIRNQYPHFYI